MANCLVGIEIGGTKLQIVSGDHRARIQQRWRFNIDRAKGAVGIRSQIETSIREIKRSGPPEAIGVGFGGPVDWRTGQICVSHHVEGWSEFPLGQWLGDIAQVPVRVDNDANTAALGEAIHGAGARQNPVFYVTLGSGVGGGLVVNGDIYHGARPGESEIGHVRLDSETIVESRCSGWAVDRRIRDFRDQNPDAPLSRLSSGTVGGEARCLTQALEKRDKDAIRILGETANALAFALSHVTHLFHPEIVVIGGGLSLIGEPLRAGVASALPHFVMKAFLPAPRIVLAGLGEDAVPVGALELAARMSKKASI